MGKLFGKKKKGAEEQARVETKSFFDCIAPATIKFYPISEKFWRAQGARLSHLTHGDS